MRFHALQPAVIGFALALTITLTLSACVSFSAPRTAPDQVEKAAARTAQAPAQGDGVPIADDLWIQLWTPRRAGAEISACVDRGSDGLLIFRTGPVPDNSGGLSYSLEMVPKDTSVNGGVGPPFFDGSTVKRLVDGCIARFPVDSRLFSVPEHDRDALYAYDLTVLRRCLLAHGQVVPRMPSRDQFDTLLRAKTPWNAYEQVRVSARAEWYALADACPALPSAIAGDVAAVTTSATTP